MIYLVTSETYSTRPTVEIVKDAVKGGVDYVQMREKHLNRKQLITLGKELRRECEDVKFIVNDNPTLAKELDADGVHLGWEDINIFPIKKTREIITEKIIGLSTHSLKQVKIANDLDIDYIAYGPVFTTQTKDYSVGTKHIRDVLNVSKKPVFFIGGINQGNVRQLYDLGAKNIAVITAITRAENPGDAIKGLKCNYQ